MASSSKKTRGRQKIEMKVIEKENDRVITFSKRRSGIYKKINEINTLCGTEILFICFSPKGKPFSFAHPSVEYVANRLFNNNVPPAQYDTHPLVEAQRKEQLNLINRHYNEVATQLDAAKEKEKALAELASEGESETNFWWNARIEQLNPQELQVLESRYQELLNGLYIARNKLIAATTTIPTPRDPAQLNQFNFF
ncbi:AGAMOUS-like 57 [Hibiscus trionum]|uniref:AGAMOUS-like 57 n=1 Tax=Hibiscus trionum TaxID=183268 RepID=A0A9W7LZQ1_HIBTR|nr:AGAMOUS-like 57 [Hibiscus trionum]